MIGQEGWGLVEAFLESAVASGRPGLVLDVGANDGRWTSEVIRMAEAHQWRNRGKARGVAPALVEFVMFEPQPLFRQRLASLVNRTSIPARRQHNISVEHISSAAWTHATTLSFFTSRQNSEVASALEAMGRFFQDVDEVKQKADLTVGAIDFASYLLGRWSRVSEPPVVLLKLDVEGGEYKLLPRLLVSAALCPVSFLHVEWHLYALPPPKRKAAIALKTSLRDILNDGCPSTHASLPPRMLYHDEEASFLNFFYDTRAVPCLMEEAAVRTNWSEGTQRSLQDCEASINHKGLLPGCRSLKERRRAPPGHCQ